MTLTTLEIPAFCGITANISIVRKHTILRLRIGWYIGIGSLSMIDNFTPPELPERQKLVSSFEYKAKVITTVNKTRILREIIKHAS